MQPSAATPGVVKLTDTPPAPLPGRANTAPLLQLCWLPEDCEVHIPSIDERRYLMRSCRRRRFGRNFGEGLISH